MRTIPGWFKGVIFPSCVVVNNGCNSNSKSYFTRCRISFPHISKVILWTVFGFYNCQLEKGKIETSDSSCFGSSAASVKVESVSFMLSNFRIAESQPMKTGSPVKFAPKEESATKGAFLVFAEMLNPFCDGYLKIWMLVPFHLFMNK